MGNVVGADAALESISHEGGRKFFQAVAKRYDSASDHAPMNKSKKKKGKKKVDARLQLVQAVVSSLNEKVNKKRAWNFRLEGVTVPVDALTSFCDVLKDDKAMKELALVSCGLTEDSIDWLGPALHDNVTLTHVDLSGNPLGPEGVKAIMEFLKEKKALRDVILNGTNAGDEGAKAVAEAIGDRKNFRAIGLADNDISEEGFGPLLAVARSNIYLIDIRLRDNDGVANEKTKEIGAVFKRNESVCYAMQRLLDNTFMQLNIRLRASQTNIVRKASQAEPPSRTREDGRHTRGRARGGTMDLSLVPSHLVNASSEEEEMEDCGDTECTRYEVGSTHTRGRRKDMQDAMLIQGNFRGKQGEDLFCVFDGHGSQESAIYAAKNLPIVLQKHLKETDEDYIASLRAAFLEINDKLSSTAIFHGTTAAVALVVGDTLYVANVGDSRVVLCRDGKAQRLTVDHKPDLPGETERVISLGGTIQNDRVNGALAVTRAFGDAQFGPLVSGDPYMTVTELNKSDSFLLVACDGLFDIFMDDVAVEIAKGCKTSRDAAVKLKDQAFISGSTDNISVMIVRLGDVHQQDPKPEHDMRVVGGVFDPEATKEAEGETKVETTVAQEKEEKEDTPKVQKGEVENESEKKVNDGEEKLQEAQEDRNSEANEPNDVKEKAVPVKGTKSKKEEREKDTMKKEKKDKKSKSLKESKGEERKEEEEIAGKEVTDDSVNTNPEGDGVDGSGSDKSDE